MQSVFSFGLGLPLVALAMSAVACAPAQTGTTSITAADVEASSAPTAPPPPVAKESSPAVSPASTEEKVAGQVVCRTSGPSGTAELVLSWDGTAARGSLELVGPSGHTTTQRVRAERYKGMIIADELSQLDLVTHAAVVTEKDGKKYMRVGDDKQPWVACE